MTPGCLDLMGGKGCTTFISVGILLTGIADDALCNENTEIEKAELPKFWRHAKMALSLCFDHPQRSRFLKVPITQSIITYRTNTEMKYEL